MVRYVFMILLYFFCSTSFSQQKLNLKKQCIETFNLDTRLIESSGLVYWNRVLWTHNDDHDNQIYGLLPPYQTISTSYQIPQLKIVDWEEIKQDKDYLYLGDFGNNYQGNRTDLSIFKVNKTSRKIDTISFSYSQQVDLSPQKSQSTNFDCEAFIVIDSFIYLFSKEWSSGYTSLYIIPNKQGHHYTLKLDSLKLKSMVTGACYDSANKQLYLCSYNKQLKPMLHRFSDFEEHHFFKGRCQKIKLRKRFLQVEGIELIDSNKLAISSEGFKFFIIQKPPQLRIIDLNCLD